MNKRFFAFAASLMLFLLISSASFGQCKFFTKKSCMPELAPFISNGQYNGATLFEGETANIVQTFYSGQKYRLFVCVHEILGDGVYFKVLDLEGNELFTNQESREAYWDFQVVSTQQLSIQIIIPEGESSLGIKQSGCVSVLVGFSE